MSDIAHPLWIEPWPLVLASASPARAAMLRAAGIPLDIAPAGIDERVLEAPLIAAHDPPETIALALAKAKAEAVSLDFPSRLVLGADQVLAAGGDLLTKPAGLAEARRQLLKLRDRDHVLYSAAAFAIDGVTVESFIATATLTMRAFSEEFLDRYLASAGRDVTTSVGGYLIESEGVHLFEKIAGDQAVIRGLPLLPLLAALRARGMLLE